MSEVCLTIEEVHGVIREAFLALPGDKLDVPNLISEIENRLDALEAGELVRICDQCGGEVRAEDPEEPKWMCDSRECDITLNTEDTSLVRRPS